MCAECTIWAPGGPVPGARRAKTVGTARAPDLTAKMCSPSFATGVWGAGRIPRRAGALWPCAGGAPPPPLVTPPKGDGSRRGPRRSARKRRGHAEGGGAPLQPQRREQQDKASCYQTAGVRTRAANKWGLRNDDGADGRDQPARRCARPFVLSAGRAPAAYARGRLRARRRLRARKFLGPTESQSRCRPPPVARARGASGKSRPRPPRRLHREWVVLAHAPRRARGRRGRTGAGANNGGQTQWVPRLAHGAARLPLKRLPWAGLRRQRRCRAALATACAPALPAACPRRGAGAVLQQQTARGKSSRGCVSPAAEVAATG